MILHIATSNTFTRPYFYFLQRHFNPANHIVLSRSSNNAWPHDLAITEYHGLWLGWAISFFKHARKADKIVLHGLNDPRIVLMLFLQPWNLKKSYWIIWGGDLYISKLGRKTLKWRLKESIRHYVIKRIGHFVTSIEGDALLARELYQSNAEYHECIAYTSNVYCSVPIVKVQKKSLNLQVGNSADPNNNHIEVFEKLKEYREENIRIVTPLSYGGNPQYIKKVLDTGHNYFGNKFLPLLKMMPIEEYKQHLQTIDIALFNHNRQQAVGNIVTLIGMGKKVYLKSTVTTFQSLKRLGIKVFDIEAELNLNPVSDAIAEKNMEIVQSHYSESRLIDQWKTIFSGT
jgi:hypothetical protein